MIEISVCESCIVAYYNGEELPDNDSVPLSRLDEGYEIGSLPCRDHGRDCDSCDSPSTVAHFGRVCDTCDTGLAGERYDYVLERI